MGLSKKETDGACGAGGARAGKSRAHRERASRMASDGLTYGRHCFTCAGFAAQPGAPDAI